MTFETDTQLEELGKADCSTIYREKISGAKCDRPELQRLLKALEPGSVRDTLGPAWEVYNRPVDHSEADC